MVNQDAGSQGSSETDGVPVFDAAVALERVDNDRELLREIAALFLDDMPRLLEELRSAAGSGDTKSIEHATHSIKGSVGNVGGLAAQAAAVALEQKVKAEREQDLSAPVDRLAREVEQLTMTLQRMLAEETPA